LFAGVRGSAILATRVSFRMMNTYASAGTADITPESAVPLAGSEIRTEAFHGVADRLEANALVLRQDGPPMVFVTIDSLFVGQELRCCVLSRLGAVVPDESLFFAASHTHFAPATDDRRPRLGRMDPRYFEQVCERVTGLVSRLLGGPLVPVGVEYAQGQANHAINRRLRARWHLSRSGPRVGAVVGAPNPVGPRDESIHLLRVSRADGGPLAVIWSYACHPVSFPRPLEVTAEYPGRVRRRLRDDLGSDLPVLFWQGFAGDVRPPELDLSTSLPSRARRLLLGPRFGRFSDAEWERWADSLAMRVAATASVPGARLLTGPIRAHRITRPLDNFVSGISDERQVAFHRVRLGSELSVVGVSAEVVTEYGALVNSTLGGSVNIPVGYIDEVYGYMPTARMLHEGGYEASWFLQPFALAGPLNPRIEDSCLSALRELAMRP
jgi:neutral ceramidase